MDNKKHQNYDENKGANKQKGLQLRKPTNNDNEKKQHFSQHKITKKASTDNYLKLQIAKGVEKYY